jgi:hypothetical protein
MDDAGAGPGPSDPCTGSPGVVVARTVAAGEGADDEAGLVVDGPGNEGEAVVAETPG